MSTEIRFTPMVLRQDTIVHDWFTIVDFLLLQLQLPKRRESKEVAEEKKLSSSKA